MEETKGIITRFVIGRRFEFSFSESGLGGNFLQLELESFTNM